MTSTDPLDQTNPEYDVHAPSWAKVRDVITGEEAVKTAGIKYLPALDHGATRASAAYDAYRARTPFYNATSRTVDGYLGMIFRKPMELKLPDAMMDFAGRAGIDGASLAQFTKMVVQEVLAVNRAGILLDMPPVLQTKPQPYLAFYAAESIRDWRMELIGGRKELSFLILNEPGEEVAGNGFTRKTFERRRVLSLRPDSKGVRTYHYSLYVKREGDEQFLNIVPATQVLVRGKPLSYIPFTFISDDDLTPVVRKPALLDLVNMNLSHYRTSADLEHGAHYTALPTPVFIGFNDDDRPDHVPLGPTEAVLLPMNGQATMLEFKGDGLKTLEARADKKERLMAILGARLLQEQKTGVETAETTRARQSADKNILSSLAENVNAGMMQALGWAAEWMAVTYAKDKGELLLKLNDEYFDQQMTGADILNLVKSWQGGGFSHDSLLRRLQKGGAIERAPEDEREQMEREGPIKLPIDDQEGAGEEGEDEPAEADE